MRLSEHLTEKLLDDKIIPSDEAAIVKYGLESLSSNVLGFAAMLLIGGVFGFFAESFVLWILVFPLRKNAGGFHANSRGTCFLISIAILMSVFVLLAYVKLSKAVCLLLTVLFLGIIFFMAPVGSQNKILDGLEQKVYRKRTRAVLALEGAVFMAAFTLGLETLSCLIMTGFAIVGFSLVAGKIKLKRFSFRKNLC